MGDKTISPLGPPLSLDKKSGEGGGGVCGYDRCPIPTDHTP